MKKILGFFIVAVVSCSFILSSSNDGVEDSDASLEIAFCLDLSESTDNLLDNFKLELWDLLLDINRVNPELKVKIAIIGSGRAYYLKENNYINVLCSLTDNLDELASKVYPIPSEVKEGKANYVEYAILSALTNLKWSKNSIKEIYVIGNGQLIGYGIDALGKAEMAASKGIRVNAIFCSNENNGKELASWIGLARQGQGEFKIYNAWVKRKLITPIAKGVASIRGYNSSLNETYVPYSPSGKLNKLQQVEVDSLIAKLHIASFQSRVLAKATSLYQNKNVDWDLVDLYKVDPDMTNSTRDKTYLDDKQEFLPKIEGMGENAIKELAYKKAKERETVLAKINNFNPVWNNYTKKYDPEKRGLKELVLAFIQQRLGTK